MTLRKLSPLLVLLVLVAMVTGCTSKVDGPVDYAVTGGFSGNGDGTALHVALDGTVTRETAQGVTQTAMLDAVTLDDLHEKIMEAQFTTLESRYSCNCADDLVYNVSVRVDGKSYTVAVDSMAQYPDRLKAVIDALRDIHERPLDWR